VYYAQPLQDSETLSAAVNAAGGDSAGRLPQLHVTMEGARLSALAHVHHIRMVWRKQHAVVFLYELTIVSLQQR